jgi:hypothetical protein
MARLLKTGEGGEFRCFSCNCAFELKLVRSESEPVRVEQCPFCHPHEKLRAACERSLEEFKRLGQALGELSTVEIMDQLEDALEGAKSQ